MPRGGRLGDRAYVSADAHGCPSCPHPATGPAIAGSPNVYINSRPALRVDDSGIHAICCGSGTWVAQKGSATVFINGRAAHRLGDTTKHCGGIGRLIEGSDNVLVGDQVEAGDRASGGSGERSTAAPAAARSPRDSRRDATDAAHLATAGEDADSQKQPRRDRGFIHFVLVDRVSDLPLPDAKFHLLGEGLDCEARTDQAGVYFRADVEFCDYRIRYGQQTVFVPTLHEPTYRHRQPVETRGRVWFKLVDTADRPVADKPYTLGAGERRSGRTTNLGEVIEEDLPLGRHPVRIAGYLYLVPSVRPPAATALILTFPPHHHVERDTGR